MRRQDVNQSLLLLPAVVFLLLLFLVPLGRFFWLAFGSDDGPFATFAILLNSDVYYRVFINTLVVALIVTGVTLLLAWPLAWLLSRLKGFWFAVTLYGVMFPLWISVLVRTFSWMLLLERNGPINRLVRELGLSDQPLPLLFNDLGVVIGMVHVLLPYAVLPLFSAMSRIDRRLLLASDGLGARLFDTFRRVYLPLALPGLLGGAALVFLLSLGFFITPALLGGASALTLSMTIATFVSERLAWDLAAAASIILLAAVLLIMGIASRLVPLQQGLIQR